jgi:hypothetical protein
LVFPMLRGRSITKFPFRVFRTDEIRERLSESRRIEPPLSRASSGSLLVK